MNKKEIESCKEAIEQFKISKEFCFIEENPYMEKFYDIVIKALKKQIPLQIRNPINMECKYNRKVKYCSNCGNTGIKNMKYCPKCGQRLDWKVYREEEYM
jgi:membrane protease subunit (stomatin/prohibitin family)